MTIFYTKQSLNFSTMVNNVLEKQTYESKMCNTFSEGSFIFFKEETFPLYLSGKRNKLFGMFVKPFLWFSF